VTKKGRVLVGVPPGAQKRWHSKGTVAPALEGRGGAQNDTGGVGHEGRVSIAGVERGVREAREAATVGLLRVPRGEGKHEDTVERGVYGARGKQDAAGATAPVDAMKADDDTGVRRMLHDGAVVESSGDAAPGDEGLNGLGSGEPETVRGARGTAQDTARRKCLLRRHHPRLWLCAGIRLYLCKIGGARGAYKRATTYPAKLEWTRTSFAICTRA
jgi:hypothetical protein